MDNSIITEEYFTNVIKEAEKVHRYQEGLNKFYKKYGAEGFVYYPDCMATSLKLLHDMLGEKDKDEWISYFCFELKFGKEYKPGKVKDENGQDISLATAEDLYKVIFKN